MIVYGSLFETSFLFTLNLSLAMINGLEPILRMVRHERATATLTET